MIQDVLGYVGIGSGYRSGARHPSLYSLGGGVIDRISIGLHVGFLVCYKKIYQIEMVSKYILLRLALQEDEVPRQGLAPCVACLVYPILLGLYSMR